MMIQKNDVEKENNSINPKHNMILDVFKLLCAILIIGIHTNLFGESNKNLNFLFVQVLPRIAVPFFFMIYSYFFAKGLEKRENKEERKLYFKNKLKHLLKIYVEISILYIIFIGIKNIGEPFSIIKILKYGLNFFIEGWYYHLWFLVALIYNMILHYIFRKNSKKIFIISIGCYIIGILIHSYSFLIEENNLFQWILKYPYIYENFRRIVTYSFPFYWLGVILQKQKIKNKKTITIGMIISILLFLIEICLLGYYGHSRSYTITIFLYPMCFFVFYQLMTTKINLNLKIDLGKMSLIIYLFHPILIEVIRKGLTMLNITPISTTIYLIVVGILLVGCYIWFKIKSIRKAKEIK